MFKHHRYPKFIILQAVYFKFRFTLSYRDIEELMKIRGVKVDHSTIQRWVFKYAPMIEASMHKRKNRVCTSWRMDETYIKVAGKDRYLYRAVDKFGDTVDFLLTKRRMKGSAQKFFNKAIANNQNPRVINIDKSGFIATNNQMKTNVDNIFAIGDIVGQPMLAHKATHEAKVAAEVISGKKTGFNALTIPSVAYTDPEVAWTGKTEKELIEAGVKFDKGVFPWAASGRSLSIGRSEGVSKALFDAESGKILGMGICGNHAGDLISEATLAIEMGCDMSDIALTIHAHPTLSETTAFAAEMAEGTITDLMPPRKKK